MRSKIVRQTQAGHERYIIHIPRAVARDAGGMLGVEWVVADRVTLQIMIHNSTPPSRDRASTKVTGAPGHLRTTVPKNLVDRLQLYGALLEWVMVTPRIYNLTVIRPKVDTVVDK